jgi:EAL domain-containing protein (putative c-di-GMP-specific phosphodiesterase class I)
LLINSPLISPMNLQASQPKAIIVDDDADIRQIVVGLAKRAGFQVRTAGHGGELPGLLADEAPHLIVLDLRMQDGDGIEAIRTLSSAKIEADLVILSGEDRRVLDASADIARERGLKLRGIFQKPFDVQALQALFGVVNQECRPFSAEELDDCMETGLLKLHFQPKLALRTRKIVGVEALLRYNGARVVSPEQLVAAAETANRMDEVTTWVFRTAVDQIARWRKKGLDLRLAVNISASDTKRDDLPELFSEICRNAALPPAHVTLELTETSVMSDQQTARETMVRLRLKGFRLSIDDVGTGYSSLVRLKQLPFSELKIDRSFAMALHQSRDNEMIVKALCHMAQDLELASVIEGLETARALEYAAACGCDEGQGYVISRPGEPGAIEELLLCYNMAM